jgi:hypothetical protein
LTTGVFQIDPFDLDVFMPHLTANIQRGTSRLATLLGVLDGGHVYSMNQVEANGQHDRWGCCN